MKHDKNTSKPPPASSLSAPAKRFLVKLMDHAFADGWRSAEEFLRYFPAPVLLESLKNAADLRVSLLGAATGLHEEILRRKRPDLAAEDLRLAIEEGMTHSDKILEVFSSEDRVRYLQPQRIWDFLAADEFWHPDDSAPPELFESRAERMAFTLKEGITERLLTPRDVLDGLTHEGLASFLSPKELREVVCHALAKGREGVGLSEQVLFELLPLERLCRVVPLEQIWSKVVLRKLAIPAGLTTLADEQLRGERAELGAASVTERPVAMPTVRPASVPPPLPNPAQLSQFEDEDLAPTAVPPSVAPVPARLVPSLDIPSEKNFLAQVFPAGEEEEQPFSEPRDVEARKRLRVTEHLLAIGRLPPNHESLPTAVLRSIDALYALLPSAVDDVQRKSVIRQSFANDNYLRSALLGLIALMDSSVDTSDPVIQEAKLDALIKILLFEEQRRKDAGRPPGIAMAGSLPIAVPPASSQSAWPPVVAAVPIAPHTVSPLPPVTPPSFVPASFPSPSFVPAGSVPPQQTIPRPSTAPAPVIPVAPTHPPLPNLPAEPSRSGRRTVPPPLPPGYQGGGFDGGGNRNQ